MTETAAAVAAYIDGVLALVENVTATMRRQWDEMSGEGSLVDAVLAFARAVDWTVIPFLLSCVGNFLTLVENVTATMRKQWDEISGQGSFVDAILAFARAVDWTEPWLIALICFHVILLMVAILTRKQNASQMTLFFSGLMGVYFAERINTVLDRHWKSFARHPYFDRHGVFLSTVWSVPILLITTLILVNSLLTLVKLLVKWKKAELRHRARLQQQKAE